MPKRDSESREQKVWGKLKPALNGQAEVIVFHVRLGLFCITCIVNIPDEDRDSAPVYVKFGFWEFDNAADKTSG